jgi:hypothetical protein
VTSPARPWIGSWRANGFAAVARVALALLEGYQRYAEAARVHARALSVPSLSDYSLYFGLTGMAFAQHEVGSRLDEPDPSAA